MFFAYKLPFPIVCCFFILLCCACCCCFLLLLLLLLLGDDIERGEFFFCCCCFVCLCLCLCYATTVHTLFLMILHFYSLSFYMSFFVGAYFGNNKKETCFNHTQHTIVQWKTIVDCQKKRKRKAEEAKRRFFLYIF